MKNLLLALSPIPLVCVLSTWWSPYASSFSLGHNESNIGFVSTRLMPALAVPFLSFALGALGIIELENAPAHDRKLIIAAFVIAELPIVSIFIFTLCRLAVLNR